MKIRLTKKILEEMDPRVREIVQTWRERYHRAFIEVRNCSSFCPSEDAHVTLLNLSTRVEQSERAAGDFAGFTRLSPIADVPLPVGVVAVVTGFFLGTPYLTIYQGSHPELPL